MDRAGILTYLKLNDLSQLSDQPVPGWGIPRERFTETLAYHLGVFTSFYAKNGWGEAVLIPTSALTPEQLKIIEAYISKLPTYGPPSDGDVKFIPFTSTFTNNPGEIFIQVVDHLGGISGGGEIIKGSGPVSHIDAPPPILKPASHTDASDPSNNQPLISNNSIRLYVTIEPATILASDHSIPLTVNIAPYDAVVVPLQEAIIKVLKENINRIVNEYDDPDRFLKTLLNFGDDTQRILTNWKRDPKDQRKLLVKLLEPLDFSYDTGNNVFISREIADSVVDTIKFELLPIADTTPWLRPLNSDQKLLSRNGMVIPNATLSSIGIDVEGIEDTYGNYSFANEILRRWYTDDYRASELNVDYSDYKNFVTFGSAELRLEAFKNKLTRIYELETNSRYFGSIATGSIFGTSTYVISGPVLVIAPTASYSSPLMIAPPSGSLTISTASLVTIISAPEIPTASIYLQEGSRAAAIEIENIIRSFDGYERYMFYDVSSSYSASAYYVDNGTEFNLDGTWPKRPDGTIYTPAEVQATNWYTIQSNIANRYDEFNEQMLSNTIPSYLQLDLESADYVRFTKLIGHFFDNIKPYIDNLLSIYDRNVHATKGLSQDLVWDVAKSFGMKLSNPHAIDELYSYVTNGTLTKSRELTSELWKRFLHNAIYLSRAKGTRTVLRALLNIFGLNEKIINIRESDTPTTGSFEIFDETTNTLNFNPGAYLKLPLSASQREIHTVQFRFNSTTPQITTLATGDEYWHMRINMHPSASSTLGRVEVTNTIGEVLLSSSYADVFSGDYYDVMLRYNATNCNLQLMKSDGEEILVESSTYDTGSYLRDALPLTRYVYLGGSGSLSLNNFDGCIDEVRVWGEETENDIFKAQVLNPGSFSGNSYDSAAEYLYIRLSFHKPTNLALGIVYNESPYKNKDGVSDPTKPLLPNIVNIITHGFPTSTDFPYQMSRITRKVYQYTTNGGASAHGSNKIIIAPPAVFLETTAAGEPILHRTKSIVSIDARAAQPKSNKFVGFFASPTDAVNNLIIRSLGNVDIGSKIGYPGNRFKESYPDLEKFKEYYNEFYAVPVNISQFVRFFDGISAVLFEQARQYIPAKTILSAGIVIEPNILERKKMVFDRPINLSGANSRRNLTATEKERTGNRDFNIVHSLNNTLDIREYLSSTAIYEDHEARINTVEQTISPSADTSKLETTIEQLVSEPNVSYVKLETDPLSLEYNISSPEEISLDLVNGSQITYPLTLSEGNYVSYTGEPIQGYSTGSIESEYPTYDDTIPIGDFAGVPNPNVIHAMVYSEIRPTADFQDIGVTTYFSKTSGIYYFEKTRKTMIGTNQYNFLTGSAATWSFGTVYNRNDVVVQQGGTFAAKYGNNKLYRYVAQNAPQKSYNYPSVDQNNWSPIFYRGSATPVPYRIVFDVPKSGVEDLRVLPLTVVDISRPIIEPSRYVTQLNLKSLAANLRVIGSVRLQAIASLFAIKSTASNIRIRLYDTVANRTADLSRPINVEPIGDHGVLFDMTITPDIQNVNFGLFPAVTLVNNDSSINGNIYYTIDEVGGTANNGVIIEFSYFAIETETIVPFGHLPRHYRFFRDTLLSTKRRNYVGCLQTQDTTTDGRSPIEVTSTAGTTLTVSPNIISSEENLGGTNLNV